MIQTIEELHDEWNKDADIDRTEVGSELLKIPKLHSKYLAIMTHHSAQSKEIAFSMSKARKIKYEYYQGDLNNPQDLEKYNLEPMTKRILKTEIPMYLESDPTLLSLTRKKSLHDEIVATASAILKELNSRTYQLRSFIEYEKFINGVN